MPVYEYLCEACKGIFETVKPIREAAEVSPCPVCDEDSKRVMPSTFTAFIVRNGYPRRIPDKGTYWHLGKEVTYLPNIVRANEHPQATKRRRKEPLSKGDRVDRTERKIVERRAQRDRMRKERTLRNDAVARTPPKRDYPPPLRPRS